MSTNAEREAKRGPGKCLGH